VSNLGCAGEAGADRPSVTLTEKVFEHLVQRCLPTLHEHFRKTDVRFMYPYLKEHSGLIRMSVPDPIVSRQLAMVPLTFFE
jgi:hypothetical protein